MPLMDMPPEVRTIIFQYFFQIPPTPEPRHNLDFSPIDTGVTIITVDDDNSENPTAHQEPEIQRQEAVKRERSHDSHRTAKANTTGSADTVDEVNRQLITTRRSLLLVCKVIHREWSPMFWSSTTIVLGLTERKDPVTFRRLLLGQMDHDKLRAIRRLLYCPLRWQSHTSELLGRPGVPSFDCDQRGVRELGRILQAYPILLGHLQSLTLFFHPMFLHVPSKYLLREDEGQTVPDKWSAMDCVGEWRALTDILTADGRETAWHVQKAVGFKQIDFFSGGTYKWATSWTLTCQRLGPVMNLMESRRRG